LPEVALEEVDVGVERERGGVVAEPPLHLETFRPRAKRREATVCRKVWSEGCRDRGASRSRSGAGPRPGPCPVGGGRAVARLRRAARQRVEMPPLERQELGPVEPGSREQREHRPVRRGHELDNEFHRLDDVPPLIQHPRERVRPVLVLLDSRSYARSWQRAHGGRLKGQRPATQ